MSRFVRHLWMLAVVMAALVGTTSAAAADPTPGNCQNDVKLIGAIYLSGKDDPNDGLTPWWELTKAGFLATGVKEEDREERIEAAFGTEFDSLEDAVAAVIAGVTPLDRNGNGFVCAVRGRGTRTALGDPLWSYYYFAATDDRGVKS